MAESVARRRSPPDKRWLEQVSTATIIRTETRVMNVAEKANDGTNACIVVTIWYELPENR
jgi:hypothetical protein